MSSIKEITQGVRMMNHRGGGEVGEDLLREVISELSPD